MVPAAEADGGIAEGRELTAQELWLAPVSATFHGRDIFAPVAARLASGLPFERTGPQIDLGTLSRAAVPEPVIVRGSLRAAAVLVDQFGNVALNLDGLQLAQAQLGEQVEVVCGGERFLATVAVSFQAVRRSDIVVLVDSYDQVAVCVNEGSAVDVLTLKVGDMVTLRRRPPS